MARSYLELIAKKLLLVSYFVSIKLFQRVLEKFSNSNFDQIRKFKVLLHTNEFRFIPSGNILFREFAGFD